MPADRELSNLSLTFTPYFGYSLILSAVTAYSIYVAEKYDWKFLWGPTVIWAFSAVYVYTALKYRILWNASCVIMRASGIAERRIGFDEITSVRSETGPSPSQARPFRRIVIWGNHHDPNAFIDVSLRHFPLEEIDVLMKEIHKHRPDLKLPTIPVGLGFW